MKSLKLNWYAAYTLPKFEKKVYGELSRKNIETYLPLQIVFRQWSDRVKKVEVPLFPNYIFVRTAGLNMRESVWAKGLLSFVSFEGRPAVVSDDDIAIIKKLEDEDADLEPDLVRGSGVRIIRGPLAGMKGILYSRKGKCRFGVRIETIRQSLSLEVPSSYLEKVELVHSICKSFKARL